MYNNTDDYQQLYQSVHIYKLYEYCLTAKILVETFTMMELKVISTFPPDKCRAN